MELPVELWFKVCKSFSYRNKQELKQLRLVCKNSEVPASSILFSNLTYTISNPRLLWFVTRASIRCLGLIRREQSSQITLTNLLLKCPNLEYVKIQGTDLMDQEHVDLINFNLNNLRKLKLKSFSTSNITKQMNITNLKIIQNEETLITILSHKFPKLKKLTYRSMFCNPCSINLTNLKFLKKIQIHSFIRNFDEFFQELRTCCLLEDIDLKVYKHEGTNLSHIFRFRVPKDIFFNPNLIKSLSMECFIITPDEINFFCSLKYLNLQNLLICSSNIHEWCLKSDLLLENSPKLKLATFCSISGQVYKFAK